MLPRLRLDIGWLDLLSALLPPRRSAADLEQAIAAHAPPDSNAVVALSVRTLYDALLAETGNSAVVMSAVTIDDMAELVRAGGRELRTIDLGPDTLSPSPEAARAECESSDAGLVLIAQLYGSRIDLQPVVSACRKPGRLIVEDCAQAFDGTLRLPEGIDVALYSFGPIKVATALGGAVGLFRDAALGERVRQRLAHYAPLAESWFVRRAIKFLGLKFLNLTPVYTAFLAVLRLAKLDPDETLGNMARGFAGGQSITDAVRHRPPRRLLALLARRLRNWKLRPDATHLLLDRLSARLTVPGLATRPRHWWLAPVMVRDPESLITALRRDGFDATTGATSMGVILDSDNEIAPDAQRMIDSIVYLPKPPDTETAMALADSVERALGATASAAPVDLLEPDPLERVD
ncbi:MAG: DegT/DnrJ/EryC1/StrS family aminotransferase [Rhizobiaceae bacterium]